MEAEHLSQAPAERECIQAVPNGKKAVVKRESKGDDSCKNFVKRQFSRHLNLKTKIESKDKMVQTFITGNFFVNTSNIYAGKLVE